MDNTDIAGMCRGRQQHQLLADVRTWQRTGI